MSDSRAFLLREQRLATRREAMNNNPETLPMQYATERSEQYAERLALYAMGLRARLREVEARLEEERRYTDEEFAAMKDDEADALARLLLRVPGPDKNVAALVAWVDRLREVEEALRKIADTPESEGPAAAVLAQMAQAALSTERTPT